MSKVIKLEDLELKNGRVEKTLKLNVPFAKDDRAWRFAKSVMLEGNYINPNIDACV